VADPERVFLTGGSGLLGSHVAERLREQGAEVVALQRPGSDTAFLRDLGCRVVSGDLTDSVQSLEALAAGCDALVHAAAQVYGGGTWASVYRVNVQATRTLITAAGRAGVRRAVHVSSVAVYGNRRGPLTEEVPLDFPLGAGDTYARSKREAEAEARAAAAEAGIRLTMVRPSVIYGERDRLFTSRLARLATLPVIPLLGRGEVPVPAVYAGNVASAVVCALEAAAGGTFNVAEDHPVSQAGLVLGLARAMGRRPRAVRLPASAVRAAAAIADGLGLRVPGASDLSLVRVARLWTRGNPYPSDRIRETLGWTPPFPLQDALGRTADWLQRSRNTHQNRMDEPT